jgi:hypothetical protein
LRCTWFAVVFHTNFKPSGSHIYLKI